MLAHVQAGSRDLERAAEALATRLPETAGRLRPPRLQLPLGLGPGRPRRLPRRSTPTAGTRSPRTRSSTCRRPRPSGCMAASQDAELLARAAARRGARERRPQPPGPRRPRARPSVRSRTSPPSTASTARSRSTRAASARSPATSSRRPPTAPGRWSRSASCTATATSASASTTAAGSTSTGSTPTRTACPPRSSPATTASRSRSASRSATIEVVAQIWRTDVGRVPLFLLDADRPENSETARWITIRLYIGDEDTRLAQYLLLGIGGVRALEAMGIEPSIVHLNEGHAAFVSLELARREYSGNGSLGAALEIAQEAHRLHHPHAGPGGQRHLPGPAGRGRARAHRRHARRRPGGDHQPRPHEPGGGGRAVRRHAVRAAHVTRRQRRLPPPRRGRPRDVARDVAGQGRRRRPDHLRHQRRAHPDLARQADLEPAQQAPRRGLAGPRDRPRHLGAGRRHPGQGDLGRPHAAARRADRVRPPSRGRRPARPRRTAPVRRGRRGLRPGRADRRLRPPPGDLQAPEPAAAGRRARDPRRRRRPPDPGAAGRQGAPARRRRQVARAGPVLA